MFDLIQAGDRTWYVDNPVKTGVWLDDEGGAYLIDSGGDKDAGKKLRRLLESRGWPLRAIVNTHSHADHIGGNAHLQQQTNCPIFASPLEAAFIRHPILEPSLLYGASPLPGLRGKFLMAQPSSVTALPDDAFPKALTVIPLPGHSPEMIGIRTPDDVLFVGDSVSSAETLQKYGVGYVYDVAACLRTLDALEAAEAQLFVPAHAEATADVATLCRLNRDAMRTVCDAIVALLAEPMTFDALLTALFRRYQLTMTLQQHALLGAALHAYLTYLTEEKRVQPIIDDRRLLWEACP